MVSTVERAERRSTSLAVSVAIVLPISWVSVAVKVSVVTVWGISVPFCVTDKVIVASGVTLPRMP